jgi:hypothetical protein
VGVSVSAAAGLFAVLGGTGLAQTALAPAHELVAQTQPAEKVEICHKGRNTISISVNALPAHLRHGDMESTCTVADLTVGGTSVTKSEKVLKTESIERTEPSANEETERSTKTKPEKTKLAWGRSKKRAGVGVSSEVSVGKVKKTKHAKKPTTPVHGFASPHGSGGASPPGHVNGHGNGKNE